MRSLLLPILLVSLSSTAMAQTDCSSVPKASDRLACYDKANPPPSARKSTKSEKPSQQPENMGDALANENARLDAKIKNICRGC